MIRLLTFVVFLAYPYVVTAQPESELWPIWSPAASETAMQLDHRPWQRFLDQYLENSADGINRVRYQAVPALARQELRSYVDSLSAIDPRSLTRQQQFPYWVNLYNAATVLLILDNLPVKSITKLGEGFFSFGPWNDELLRINGVELTLNDIEHRILRPIWNDNRIHYVVNCASLGCPNLRKQALTAENTEGELEQAAIDYINHPRGLRFDDGELVLSKIFNWYQEDFGDNREALLAHLSHYHRSLKAQIKAHSGMIKYEYDWGLNSTPKP